MKRNKIDKNNSMLTFERIGQLLRIAILIRDAISEKPKDGQVLFQEQWEKQPNIFAARLVE